MDQIGSLYAHVQSVVLDSLRREWQRYGWEDGEIDDRVEKLRQLWSASLASSGALPPPSDPSSSGLTRSAAADDAGERKASTTAGAGVKEEGENGEAADGKRKRRADDDGSDKRFKSGPRVAAPLTYPTLPHSTAVPSYQPLSTAFLPSAGQRPHALPRTTPTSSASR